MFGISWFWNIFTWITLFDIASNKSKVGRKVFEIIFCHQFFSLRRYMLTWWKLIKKQNKTKYVWDCTDLWHKSEETALSLPVTVPTEEEGGNKQIDAQKSPLPHSTVLLLGSRTRSKPHWKVGLSLVFVVSWLSTKVTKHINEDRIVFSTNGAGTNPHVKTWTQTLTSHYTQIQSQMDQRPECMS